MPDSSERHMAMDLSTTSMATTAPEMAPMPAPRTRPLSVASPIIPPVMAPRIVPTATTQVDQEQSHDRDATMSTVKWKEETCMYATDLWRI